MCLYVYSDIVLELIKQGSNVNITVFDCSPPIMTCSEGYVDIVLELLKHGADANITVSDNSPLVAGCSIQFFQGEEFATTRYSCRYRMFLG